MKMTQRKCNLFVHWSEAAKTAFHPDIGLRLHSGCFLGYSSHELFLKSLSKEKSMKLNFEYDFSLRKAKSVFVHDGGGHLEQHSNIYRSEDNSGVSPLCGIEG